jgi:hypothetical protein
MDFIVLRRQHNMLLAHFYGDLSDNTLTSIDTKDKALISMQIYNALMAYEVSESD